MTSQLDRIIIASHSRPRPAHIYPEDIIENLPQARRPRVILPIPLPYGLSTAGSNIYRNRNVMIGKKLARDSALANMSNSGQPYFTPGE